MSAATASHAPVEHGAAKPDSTGLRPAERWRALAGNPFQTPQWYRAAGLGDSTTLLTEPAGGLVPVWLAGDGGSPRDTHSYHAPEQLFAGLRERLFPGDPGDPRRWEPAVLTVSPYGYRGGPLLPPGADAGELAARLVGHAQDTGASLVLSHYLFDGVDDRWLDALGALGGVPLVLGAQCTMEVGWESLADYHRALGTSRRTIRQQHEQWRRAGNAVEVHRGALTGAEAEHVVGLLVSHATGHGDPTPPTHLYRELVRGGAELNRVLLLVREPGGTVRSALVVLVHGGCVYPKFFGSRQPRADYLSLVYPELIAYAIEAGHRRIDYGGSAHQAKMYRGARLRYALGVLLPVGDRDHRPLISLGRALSAGTLAHFGDLAARWHLGRRAPGPPRQLNPSHLDPPHHLKETAMAVKTSVPMVVRVGELAGSATPAGQVSVTGRLLFDEGRPRLADGMHTIALAGPQAPQYAWIDVTGEWTGTELRVDTTHVIRAPEESPGTAGIPEALLAREPDRTASIVHNAALLGEVRRFLDLSGFVEVKTPMLQAFPEISFFHQGRTQPMQGTVFHLRTDPEEYLKRFLTAGLDSVYEISTNIRDDADDSTHLTEFQSLEFYRRLMSFESALDLADELIRQVARRLARCIAPRRAGIEAGGPFERIRYAELTQKLTGIDITAPQCQSTAGLAAAIAAAGLHCGPAGSASGWRRDLLDALFDDHVLPQVEQPTWVTHFPVDLAYSYRLDPEDPQSTLRAELYLPGGLEIAHVYENLTVEQDLRARYELRRQHRLDGGLGEVRLNEELLRSMRIGMPPMAGGAIGIERLLMVVLGDKEIGSGVLFGREIARARAADAKRNGETA